MDALRFDGTRVVFDSDSPAPQPGAGEALIDVSLAGICSTDLEIVRGYAGFTGVLGHEFVGVVAACASRPDLVGRRVAAEINVGCGVCWYCARGVREHCEARQVIGIRGRDGAFARQLTAPVVNLHPVPQSVPDEMAVFIEPLAAALQVREQVMIRPTDRVAVLGVGRLGQLVVRSLVGAGGELAAVGRDLTSHKMAILRAAGIETVERGSLPAGWADVVVECTGSQAGFADALELVRPQGVIVLKSTYHGAALADLSRVVVDEIRVVGSRCGPFDAAIGALARGQVDPRPLIDAVYPLADGLAALAHAARPGVLKVLLHP